MKALKLFVFAALVLGVASLGFASANGDGYGYGYDKDAQGNITVTSEYEALQLEKQPLFVLVKNFGYNWETDRKMLAAKAGLDINTYVGSYTQNMVVKNMFKNKIYVKKSTAISTPSYAWIPTIKVSSWEANQLKHHTVLYEIVKKFGYNWYKDKWMLAEKMWIPNYVWNREQNMLIRAEFLKHIEVK